MAGHILLTHEDALAFFFDGMTRGYVSDLKPLKKNPLVGWKLAPTYERDDLRLVDMWHTTKGSSHSSGITTIYWKSDIVWCMHYGGWYADRAISTLKAALGNAYESRIFIGGRGPERFKLNGITYTNTPSQNLFSNFAGAENIVQGNEILGTHWYRGGWQLD